MASGRSSRTGRRRGNRSAEAGREGQVDWQLGFLLAHAVVAPGWLALLFLDQRHSVRIAHVSAAILAAVYLIIFLLSAPAANVLRQDYSLAGVGRFFDEPALQLLGW